MERIKVKKSIAIGIILLFVGLSILPTINGHSNPQSNNKTPTVDISSNAIQLDETRNTLIYNPIDDTFVDQYNPNTPNGDLNCLIVRPPASGLEISALVKFDISSIPAGTTITSATFKLYYFHYNDANPSGHTLALHRITSTWNEETVTYNTRPTYDSAILTTSTVPSTYQWMTWDVTAAVQNIVNGQTNYGWQLMDHGSGNPMIYFYSKEYSNQNYFPTLQVTYAQDLTPPVTRITINDPHYVENDNSVWVTSATPITLTASDNPAIPDSAINKGVQSTYYRIDDGPEELYTGPFTLQGCIPEYPHQIEYWSVDYALNEEAHNIYPSLFIDDTPPEVTQEPLDQGIMNYYGFPAYYSDPNQAGYPERQIQPFKDISGNIQLPGADDEHPQNLVDYEGNTHVVWMSKPGIGNWPWEVYYKEYDPDGFANPIGGSTTKVLVDTTRISDDNTSDSLYPALAQEKTPEVFINDTQYQHKYALLAAPVRLYIDQQQRDNNSKIPVKPLGDANVRWQQFIPMNPLAGTELGWWIDVIIYKDPSYTFTKPLNLSVYPTLLNGQPNWNMRMYFCQIQPWDILNGYQWLAFYGNYGVTNLIAGTKYSIVVESQEPYEWCYKNADVYIPGISSLGANADFAFIERYEPPEMRFKHEISMMRTYLLSEGYTDNDISVLTIPYIIDAQRWRIPSQAPFKGGYKDPNNIWWEWQPISYNFTAEKTWIDGNATQANLSSRLTQLKNLATSNDFIFINLHNHGGGGNGEASCPNGYRPLGSDPRVAHDEINDGVDEAFCTYDYPNEGWDDTNYWYDDELDIQLDQIQYKHMVVLVDTCHSGGFIPDICGPGRIILSSCTEDQVSYSYMYRLYERLDITRSPAADTNGDGKISIQEAHDYVVKRLPIESPSITQTPQIDIYDNIHVIWVDHRTGHNEIYCSKLGSIIDCSASLNGVDQTHPDVAVSARDGLDSGRVVFGTYEFIEHPDIAADADNNLHIVWSDHRNGNWQIYYQKQDSNAIPTVLIDDTKISNNNAPFDAECPAIDIDTSDHVHIAWQSNEHYNAMEIIYQKQDKTGTVLIDDTIASDGGSGGDGSFSVVPDIATDTDGNAYVTYMDQRPVDPGHVYSQTHILGCWEVYTVRVGSFFEKRQSDMAWKSNWAWGQYTGLPDGESMYPQIKVSGDFDTGQAFLIWQDNRNNNGQWQIFYTTIPNSCHNPNGNTRLTTSTADEMFPVVAFDRNNHPHINYQSNPNTDWDILGARWNGQMFMTIEIDGIPYSMLPGLPFGPRQESQPFFYNMPLTPGVHTYDYVTSNGLLGTTTASGLILEGTPVGLWHFDENSGTIAHDATDFHNDGTISGATWTPGHSGFALSFDGINDYVTVPHSPSLDITEKFAVDAWIKCNGTGNYYAIVDKSSGSPTLSQGFTLYLNNGRLRLSLYCDTYGNKDISMPEPDLRDNTWHYVAGLWDGTNVQLIVDDQQIESPWTHPPASTSHNLGIGKRLYGWGGTMEFNGIIDEVRLLILNNPPNIPNIPNPSDGKTEVPTTADLSWTGGDPDAGDGVTYDVYFGSTFPPQKLMNNQTMTTYDPGTMTYNTTYFWQIIAYDNHHEVSPGAVWGFTTEAQSAQPPNMPIHVADGCHTHDHPYDMNKGIGKLPCFVQPPHGVVQTFSTTSTNTGQIYYKFFFGDGTNSTWLGPYTSGQVATATHDYNNIGIFQVTAIAKIGVIESVPSPALSVRMFKSGDINGDNLVNFGDINPFVSILTNSKAVWYTQFPNGYWWTGDINNDCSINFGDINPFVQELTSCPP